jgi:sulfur-carrier protein adenylyltransferase/sulfurtransferase
MAVTIRIPTPLRPFTAQQASVSVEATSVAEALTQLTAIHTGLGAHLFGQDGALRSFVNVYVNDDDIRHLQQLNTPVSSRDTISIVPSVAGGSGAAAEATGPVFPPLSQAEVSRYSRHLIMPEVGVEGQQKLKAARVLCVGAGGLGSPASLYLAAAGIGTLGLVDFDTVDVSNLQRQVLYSTADVGRRKLDAAADRLRGLNPDLNVIQHETRLTSANALDILKNYDVIVDGADNFPTRYLVNDACVLLGRPNAYGSIFRFDGQASVFGAPGGPCYRCLYPEPPPAGLVPSCAEGGVLGVLPGLVGTIQATEAIKLIIGAGQTLAGRLLLIDALTMEFRTVKARRDPACPVCGDHPTVTGLIDYEQFCGISQSAEPEAPAEFETTVEVLKSRLDRRDDVWLLDVREPSEAAICRIPGATLIPLGELARRLNELPLGAGAPDIVVHCKMGGRSAKAVQLLREHGVTRVQNLTGGILAWIDRIDPTQTKY